MDKYLRHLTPANKDWMRTIPGDLLAVCSDPELPVDFRLDIMGSLCNVFDEIKKLMQIYEMEEY